MQYFVGLAGVALLGALLRRFRPAALFALLAGANLATIASLHVGGVPPGPVGDANSAGSPLVRAVLFNVHSANRSYAEVESFIRRSDAHVVVLVEVTDDWLRRLDLRRFYPHAVEDPHDANFGIALYSKFPFREARVLRLGEANVSSLGVEVDRPEGSFHVVATHPFPPTTPARAHLRNDQLEAIAAHVRGLSGPVVLLGDLNTTPWSPHFRRLLETSGLQDSSRGHGVLPTWPALLPWILRIPLDHCLHSPGISVRRREVGPDLGSDHLPLLVEFRVDRLPGNLPLLGKSGSDGNGAR